MKRFRSALSFFAVIVAIYWIQACKSTGDKNPGADDAQATGYGGTFNNNDEIKIKVPAELKGLVPTTKSSDAKIEPPVGMEGLGLAGPVTSKGVETVIMKCFRHDSEFIADGWRFYAELESEGEVQKTFSQMEVNHCNEMQIALSTLDKTKNYVVRASFYWYDPETHVTIVWYEGVTKPFKPRDENRSLILKKLRQDQVIDVDIEKGTKDRCILANYLWNGQRCLDNFNAISFESSDLSDYASKASTKIRKCLQIQPSLQAVQSECRYSATQMVRPKLHGVDDQPERKYGWFVLEFDTSPAKCLTVVLGANGTDPTVSQAPCKTRAFAGGGVVPIKEQLFTLIESEAGDGGGRNTFRLTSMADNTARCLSVPPIKGDVSGAAPLNNGAPVRMTSCDKPGNTDLNVKRSQFINFVDGTN